MPERRPNIIFIVADDFGYADLGCTGQTDYRTPALDGLAAEGIRFTQAYANSPLCTNTLGRADHRPLPVPAAAGWSSRSARAREAPDMGLPPGIPTLPSLLRGAGYRTALIGKWHLGYPPRYGPLRSGYEEFFGIMGGFTGYFTHSATAANTTSTRARPRRAGGLPHRPAVRPGGAWVDDAAARPEPFFLSLHYTAPHWPWEAPGRGGGAAARGRSAPS